MNLLNLIIIIIWFSFFTLACEHDLGQDQQGTLEPTFSSIQQNILTPKCVNAGCHNPTPGPMSLQTGIAYNNLFNVTSTGYAPLLRVNPNDADNSVLYLKVMGDARTGSRMPLGRNALSTEEVNAIREWINNGAENN